MMIRVVSTMLKPVISVEYVTHLKRTSMNAEANNHEHEISKTQRL